MKSLLEIYSAIFQKCETEKSNLNDEMNLICQAAEVYVEELLSKDRWKYIIKKDIEDLKASLQMRQNYIRNHDGVDEKDIGIVTRYEFGIDSFLFMISHEMERYGYNIDDVENPQVQGTTQTDNIPETGDHDGDDSNGDGDEGESGYIKLPLPMNTHKAKVLFTAALDQEWIIGDEESGYKWVGFGNTNVRTNRVVSCTNKLAYLCHKIYEPLTPPWQDIESFFGEKRLDRDWSNIEIVVSDPARQSWMNTIDYLIRNKGF